MYHLLSNLKTKESSKENSDDKNSDGEGEESEEYVKQPLFNSFDYEDDLPTYCCSLCGIQEIMEEMENSETNNIFPLGIKDIIKKVFGEEVRIGRQHDAHEFLMILLHTLSDSECYKKAVNEMRNSGGNEKKNVELDEIFEGSFTTTIT